jgi:hypothetical protein
VQKTVKFSSVKYNTLSTTPGVIMAKAISYVPWKRYIFAVSQAVIVFTLATFLLGYLAMHTQASAYILVPAAFIYLNTIAFSIFQMVKRFSLAAIMLMVPIVPLVILIIVVSLIHLLQAIG